MKGYIYDIRWSDQIDEEFLLDFLYIQNIVFNCGTREEFKRQFEDNIYGRSLIVVVYWNGDPVAARALWRNDILDRESYQLGNAGVLPDHRRKGVFAEMTKRAMNMLPKKAILYSFPNPNSFPGYIKMGWNLINDYKESIYLSYSRYIEEHPVMIDEKYAKWWLLNKHIKYVFIRGHYFLVQKDKRPFCYKILGEVKKELAYLFPKALFAIIFYKSVKITWYNKSLGVNHVVSRNLDIEYIPLWKIDVV